MLFNNLTTERRASLIVKNSRFYIEIAKFVQAYTTIVKNPNEFLAEINEPFLDSKKQHLNWDQLKKIMQTCDFGFEHSPSDMDLLIYYNYAIAMGSVTALDKKIASVDQVAEAQKHYYNFIDEEKTNAEEEYLKQKKIYEARQREMSYVDGKIAVGKAKNVVLSIMMFLSVVIGLIGMVSIFVDNKIASTLGKIIPIWKEQYIGAIIMIVLMFVLFALFNSLFNKSKYEFERLRQASATLFDKEDELIAKQQVLKNKLDEVSKDYNTVIKEINDKHQKYDVKHNIDVLINTNKYYQQYCETEELNKFAESFASESTLVTDDYFAPIKLTKEQEENMRSTKIEVIGLAGQFDKDAYNEMFEYSDKKKNKEDEKEQEEIKKEDEELKQKLDEQKLDQERKGFQESMDYVKDLLGMNEVSGKTSEIIEKEK